MTLQQLLAGCQAASKRHTVGLTVGLHSCTVVLEVGTASDEPGTLARLPGSFGEKIE